MDFVIVHSSASVKTKQLHKYLSSFLNDIANARGVASLGSVLRTCCDSVPIRTCILSNSRRRTAALRWHDVRSTCVLQGLGLKTAKCDTGERSVLATVF